MTHRKDAEPVRTTRESEIFRDPPGSGNYSSSIGAAQGIELFSGSGRVRRARPTKTIFEPARQVPVFAETDVLVVGGGPAGTAAAIAAARLGADVLLVERYNHLGGLSTGGLVIWIDRMTDWSGRHIIRGLADELMERLPKDAIQGPPRGELGKSRCRDRRLLGATNRGLPRDRHLVADD
jgi:FAD dependent oxidoreductase